MCLWKKLVILTTVTFDANNFKQVSNGLLDKVVCMSAAFTKCKVGRKGENSGMHNVLMYMIIDKLKG